MSQMDICHTFVVYCCDVLNTFLLSFYYLLSNLNFLPWAKIQSYFLLHVLFWPLSLSPSLLLTCLLSRPFLSRVFYNVLQLD